MADRYWILGTGTWDATTTTNWSTSSGGSGGASVPTAADNVFFDANSNVLATAFTVTMATTPRVCNDFTASGLDGTMTLAGSGIGLTVSGSLTFQATNFTRTYTGTTTFNATTTGKTVTTNGVSLTTITFDGVGGAWTLGSALTASSITITNGTFDTSSSGNYAVTASAILSNNSNTRTINLNASTITLSGVTGIDFRTATGLTLNAGTSQINLSSFVSSFRGGGLTFYNVSFTTVSANASFSLLNADTFNNLTFPAKSNAGVNTISITANIIVNGTLTIGASTDASFRTMVTSSSVGTSRTLTVASIASLTNIDFREIVAAGASGTWSGTRLGDCGGNSNITFSAGVNKYWNLAGGGLWSATAWATSSGGSVATTNFPLPQDSVIIENTGLNTSATITVNATFNIGSFDTSARTNAMTFTTTDNPTFYGNFTYGSGVTPTTTFTYTFINRSIKTLNSGGKTFGTVIFQAPNGGIQLVTNDLTLISTVSVTLIFGTLDLNGRTLTVGTAFTTATGTKNLTFNGGTLICPTAATTAFNNAVPTGFTTTAGTGTGAISMTAATAKTFVGGGSTFNCTLNQGGAGALTITGANTFSNITNTYKSTGATSILFTAGTTSTFTDWNANGETTRLLTIGSVTAASHTLSKASGTVSASYLSISQSTATGGATWNATNSTDGGNNSGWVFVATATATGNFLVFF